MCERVCVCLVLCVCVCLCLVLCVQACLVVCVCVWFFVCVSKWPPCHEAINSTIRGTVTAVPLGMQQWTCYLSSL